MIYQFSISVLISNSLAYSIAVVVSFVGHYYWTFPEKSSVWGALYRFVPASLLIFGVNNFVLAFLIDLKLANEYWSVLFSQSVIPVTSFIINKKIVFKSENKDAPYYSK